MADAPNAPQSPANQPDPGPGAGQATGMTGAAAAPEAAAAEVPQVDLKLVVAELEGQIRDLTDRLLRAHAEMDNMRKRAEREKAETAKYAITRFATDVVTLGDNLSRALTAVPPEAAEAQPALKGLLDGVDMTDRAFLSTLERHGIRRLDPKGEIFNPHLHQAIAQIHNPEVPAGSIIQVHQTGYTIEDRVLRPAIVVVAQGGFKPVKQPQPPADNAASPASAKPAGEDPGGTTAA